MNTVNVHFEFLRRCYSIGLKCARVECFQISAGDTVCSALAVVNHLTPTERNGNVQQEIIPQNTTCCQVITLEFNCYFPLVFKNTVSIRDACICSSKQHDDVVRHFICCDQTLTRILFTSTPSGNAVFPFQRAESVSQG